MLMLALSAPNNAHARHIYKESCYRDTWCNGKTEVRLPNGNRADCITKKYAVEIEFASKYHQAIGQALDYSDQTGLLPAILLIIETDKDWRYYNKLKPLAKKHNIAIWYISPDELRNKHTPMGTTHGRKKPHI